jgi:hypothetical protein
MPTREGSAFSASVIYHKFCVFNAAGEFNSCRITIRRNSCAFNTMRENAAGFSPPHSISMEPICQQSLSLTTSGQ